MINKLLSRKLLTILMHMLMWTAVFLVPHLLSHRPGPENIGISDVFLWCLMLILFYTNYYLLVPKYLTRKRFVLYSLSVIILLTIAFTSVRHIALTIDSQREIESLMKRHDPEKAHLILYKIAKNRGMGAVFFSFLVLAVSTSIRVTGDWYSMDKKRKEIENEKLSTELNLLKSQVNPHFFFNTLNNIYSLAIQKSEKTSEAIVKLSQLMRYVIYDTDKDKVPLSKEIEYIRNYIELEQLRLHDNVEIKFIVDGNVQDKLIEPLLLLPFIENAFKHGIDYHNSCVISIRISVFNSRLILCVENPLPGKSDKKLQKKQGIGRYNAERRLQLLYGDKYSLETTVADNNFHVELILNLVDDEMPGS
ncbi:MAG: histidine kinase [Bacteroidales bacterium]|nr:histidine kinase [Bacteroidales bacterium]MBN2761798.1 histidine kinase [Bacteroidales bacterium]